MSVRFSQEEMYLLVLLKTALAGQLLKEEDRKTGISWSELLEKAQKHAVLSMLYDIFAEADISGVQRKFVDGYCKTIVSQNYHLLFLTKYLVGLFQQNNVEVLVLKGVATAAWYPVPELRKSGDVDLLVSKAVDMEKVTAILKEAGFESKEEQHANYHREFVSGEGMSVEVHTDFTEHFASKQLNAAMERQVQGGLETMVKEKALGVELPMLSRVYHGYELLLHMLHHFTTSGFGLKLLCDWVVCWRQDWTSEEKEVFRQLTSDSKTNRFAEAVTEVCVRYLGLEPAKFAWGYSNTDIPTEELLREILDAEEFGKNDNRRMVMMNGTGFFAYVREFQHQMHLNFPKAGKCFLLWPVLWGITFFRFLKNNRKVRNTSTREILKEAKRRSALMEKLKIMKS